MRRAVPIAAWTATACLLLWLLAIWQGDAYVSYSDGVYAASARLVERGLVPYRSFAAAQPPGVYYLGAALLWLGDSVLALRRALSVVELIQATLVFLIVIRLTGRRGLAGAAGLVSLLAPWSLYGHDQLLPETFGAPLLLAAALTAARPRYGSWAAGLLGAGSVLFKVAFLLPAVAIGLAALEPALAVGALAAGLATSALGCSLTFGAGFWRDAFQAQAQTGTASAGYLAGLLGQAAWNLLPLLPAAAIAVLQRGRARDAALLRTVTAGAAGSLALAATMYKAGSYVNVMAPAEPLLVALGACGCAWMLPNPGRMARGTLAAGGLLLCGQVGSLLLSPTSPALFGRPAGRTSPAWALSIGSVSARLRLIARCPTGVPFSGRPFLAFASGRRMPGNQPDVFIIENAPVERRFLTEARRDRPWCPQPPL